jgi:hypothetical protein
MSEHGDDLQKRTILANLYARDQLQALLAAEESHGFIAVEWIKRGADEWVNPADLGRVLTLKRSRMPRPVRRPRGRRPCPRACRIRSS